MPRVALRTLLRRCAVVGALVGLALVAATARAIRLGALLHGRGLLARRLLDGGLGVRLLLGNDRLLGFDCVLRCPLSLGFCGIRLLGCLIGTLGGLGRPHKDPCRRARGVQRLGRGVFQGREDGLAGLLLLGRGAPATAMKRQLAQLLDAGLRQVGLKGPAPGLRILCRLVLYRDLLPRILGGRLRLVALRFGRSSLRLGRGLCASPVGSRTAVAGTRTLRRRGAACILNALRGGIGRRRTLGGVVGVGNGRRRHDAALGRRRIPSRGQGGREALIDRNDCDGLGRRGRLGIGRGVSLLGRPGPAAAGGLRAGRLGGAFGTGSDISRDGRVLRHGSLACEVLGVSRLLRGAAAATGLYLRLLLGLSRRLGLGCRRMGLSGRLGFGCRLQGLGRGILDHACSTFFQSARKRSRPRSVRGCSMHFLRAPKGTVAMSAPMSAAWVTW